MGDDFFLLKLLIVSDIAAERELLLRAAAEASSPIDVAEIGGDDIGAACRQVARDSYDAVLFDSGIARPARQELLGAIRAAPGRPLAILVGAATKAREVPTDGLDVDGTLAKPIELEEARAVMEASFQARLPRRALIVDDSATVRSVVRKVLQASRFRLRTEEAAEGGAAIARATRDRFDVVFLDCNMPGIDGFAALAALRRACPGTKVVMITADRDAAIKKRAHAEGAHDFLYKPFFARDIDAVLNRMFGLTATS